MSDTTTEKKDNGAAAPAADAEAPKTATEEAAPGAASGDSEAPEDDALDAVAGADEADEALPDAAPEAPKEPTLEEKLEESKKATKSMKEKMLRVAADFENYRRRSNKEVDDARKRGKQAAIKDLLPVFDNLERATGHVDAATDAQSMADGLRMVHKQFIDVLAKIGIDRIEAVGQGFDPNLHESIQYEHSEDYAAGIVMNELQPGYRQGTQLIRPAMVMVSRGPAPKEEPAAEGGADEAKADEAGDEAKAEDASSDDAAKADEASDDAGKAAEAAEEPDGAKADVAKADDAKADGADAEGGAEAGDDADTATDE